MKKISNYIMENKWPYFFAILSMIISVSLDMFSPQLTQRIIDNVIVAGQISQLKWLLLGILVVGIGRAVFQYT